MKYDKNQFKEMLQNTTKTKSKQNTSRKFRRCEQAMKTRTRNMSNIQENQNKISTW